MPPKDAHPPEPDDAAASPERPPQRSMGKRMGIAALILSVSALLSRLLGFAREVIISAQHGASAVTDAYYAAFTFPELMSYFLAGGTLSITFIPLFSSYMARDDEEGGWRLFSNIATVMGLVLVTFTILGYFLAPWITTIVAPGFTDPAQRALVTSMTRIVLPAQLAFYLGGLLQATLFVREVFWTAAVAPLIYNLCIILGGVLLAPWLGVQGFAVGVLVGALLGPLGMPLWAARAQVRYRFTLALRDEGMRRFFWLTLPLMLGATLVTMDEFFLRIFGSRHPEGAISWLTQSRKLMMVLFAIIGQAAGQAALPFLSRLHHEGRHRELGEMIVQSLQRLIFLSMMASAALASVAWPLVFLIFERGKFSIEDANKTASLLVIFCVGLTAWTVQSFAVRGFYAREDTATPMIFGTVVLLIMAPVYWLLDTSLGVYGLALSTSVGIGLNAAATLWMYRRKYGALELGALWTSVWRGALLAAASGGAAGAVIYGLSGVLDWQVGWHDVLAIVLAALAYLIVAGIGVLWLKPAELDGLLLKVSSRVKRLRRAKG